MLFSLLIISLFLSSSFGISFDDVEEHTTKSPDSFVAIQKCGEGRDKGKRKCVEYYRCDPKSGLIREDPDDTNNGYDDIDIRLGPSLCDSYLEVCCNISQSNSGDSTTTTVRPKPITIRTTTPQPLTPMCGIRNENGIDFRIKGNTNNEAEYGEFPWMSYIVLRHFNPVIATSLGVCGGSIIHPKIILTAAHCIQKYQPWDLQVRVGEWDTQTTRERYPYQEINVLDIIKHEEYDGRVFNDIALLVLEKEITYARHIGSICLPPQGLSFDSKECYVTGWGVEHFGNASSKQEIMKKVQLPLVHHEQCEMFLRKTRLGPKFKLHDSFICAGGEAGKDACTGDGGSPLVCPNPYTPGRYVQMGIVSWGIGCGQVNVPGVYVDLALYRWWIDEQLKKLKLMIDESEDHGGTSATTPSTTTRKTPDRSEEPEKCGEGSDEGKRKCVPFYRCDPNSNYITDEDINEGYDTIDIRQGANQCENVLETCCNIPQGNTTTSTTVKPTMKPTTVKPPQTPTCGIRNEHGIGFHITGNQHNEAEFGEFPWMVFLSQRKDDSVVCGGTLINSKVVLTAARCLQSFQVQDLKVRAGEWDISNNLTRYPNEEINVQQIIVHENYDGKFANNVALLIMEKAFRNAPNIQNVCLPPQGLSGRFLTNISECFFTGWRRDFNNPLIYDDLMKKLESPLIDVDECEEKLRSKMGTKVDLPDISVCAGSTSKQTSCFEEGGNPLVCPDPIHLKIKGQKRYIQVGIFSFSSGCEKGLPRVFVDVGLYRYWIDKTLSKLNFDTSSYKP